jgi:hypothetical protein
VKIETPEEFRRTIEALRLLGRVFKTHRIPWTFPRGPSPASGARVAAEIRSSRRHADPRALLDAVLGRVLKTAVSRGRRSELYSPDARTYSLREAKSRPVM